MHNNPDVAKTKGKEVTLGILRGQDTLTKQLTLTPEGMVGVEKQLEGFFEVQREKFSMARMIVSSEPERVLTDRCGRDRIDLPGIYEAVSKGLGSRPSDSEPSFTAR